MARTRKASPAGTTGTPRDRGERDLPGWVVPAGYLLATVLLFHEVFLTGASLLGTDSFALSYFARAFYTDAVRTLHRFPLWNPYIFGGLPFIDGMHGDIFYPFSLALFFLDARTMWGWKMVLHIFLAGAFMYLWLRRGLGLSRGAAFIGGLVYMMGADLVSLVLPGGDGKLFVSALAPLVFWLAERAAAHQRVADFAFFALGITLIVLTSHMQLAYFCVWGVSLYFMFRLWQIWRAQRRAGRVARLATLFACAGLLGVGAAAIQFLPPLQYLREWSQRTEKENRYEYATSYSLHPEELVSLAVPEYIGDSVRPAANGGETYWGRNPFKLNHEYAGLIPLLLLPVLLLRRREGRTWFFLALGGLALLYALGATTPVFRLFYLVPGVKLFRAPSIIIFLYSLSLATLGALAVERLLAWRRTEENAAAARYFLIAAGTLGGLALLASAGVLTSAWTATIYRGIGPDKQAALANNLPSIKLGFWIAFAFALLVAGWWELLRRAVVSAAGGILLLALLAALDLYRVDRPFVAQTVAMNRQAGNGSALFTPDETIRFLQERRDAGEVFRVYDLAPAVAQNPGAQTYETNALAVHGIEQVGGHHGNEMARYKSLVGDDNALAVLQTNLRLGDLLNAVYLISPQRLQVEGLQEVFAGSRSAVYRNPKALPRAFLVGQVEVLDGPPARERMLAEAFDPRQTAIVAKPLPVGADPQAGARGTVTWEAREHERSRLRVSADRPALLVVTDNYYPAWKARLDGREVPVQIADYAFRGVAVGAGEHTVEFYFDAGYLRNASLTSAGLLLVLLAIGVGGMVRDRRQRAA
ncbi:MAG: hypothetical protein FIB01_06385 [Gemmatimonadetes bacterium]|nr:hypothetical protein [Gemmatimonadota bacterium]